MSHSFLRTEAIILRVIPFRDYDNILTLFTLDAGLIKVLYRGSRSRRGGVQGICLPLTGVEVVYTEKNSEIFNCREMALVEPYHFLRKELIYLDVACDLLQVISSSLLINKAAPDLYQLLRFYLERIPRTLDPWILTVSFRLKFLIHEGLSTIPFICSACGDHLLEAASTNESAWYCCTHQEPNGIFWSQEEVLFLYHLSACQHFNDLASCTVSLELKDKVEKLFRSTMLSG